MSALDSPRNGLENANQTRAARRIAIEDGVSLRDASEWAKEGSLPLGQLGLVGFSAGTEQIINDGERFIDDGPVHVGLNGVEEVSLDYTGTVSPYS